MKTISVIIPCYNEEENIEAMYKALKEKKYLMNSPKEEQG